MIQKNTKESKMSKKAWIVIGLLFLLTAISNIDKAIIGFASVPIMEELAINSGAMGDRRQCILSIILAFSSLRWSTR